MVSLLGLKGSMIIGSIFLALSNLSFIFWGYNLYVWMFINIVFLTLSRTRNLPLSSSVNDCECEANDLANSQYSV